MSRRTQLSKGCSKLKSPKKKTSLGEIGLIIGTLASLKVEQDQVFRGVSVLCWHVASVANVPWNPRAIGSKAKFGNKVQISYRVKIGVMSYQQRMSLYMVIVQNFMWHSGEGDLILFNKIRVPTIELP